MKALKDLIAKTERQTDKKDNFKKLLKELDQRNARVSAGGYYEVTLSDSECDQLQKLVASFIKDRELELEPVQAKLKCLSDLVGE